MGIEGWLDLDGVWGVLRADADRGYCGVETLEEAVGVWTFLSGRVKFFGRLLF